VRSKEEGMNSQPNYHELVGLERIIVEGGVIEGSEDDISISRQLKID